MKISIIGIPDSEQFQLGKEAMSMIAEAMKLGESATTKGANGTMKPGNEAAIAFSGGRRHRELMAQYLPENAAWIDITVPLSAVFEQYKHYESVVVFASGDPLFYGFANTLLREMPEATLKVCPWFNSLQMLSHRILMPYHDMRIVSLTGRPWHEFDRAMIEHAEKVGVLTDKRNTPAVIAQRMLDYGFAHYTMTVGEHLGNEALERITTLSLAEASQRNFSHPNCLILRATDAMPPRRYGIPETEFALLDGRTKMITKMPIRLLSLQALELHACKTLWDVGFCTGSVSIEARLQFPHLHIEAFEIREEGSKLMETNSHRFSAPGIETHIGDFLTADLAPLPHPDAVFIGGHGGRLKEIMQRLHSVMMPGGVIVMNSVTEQSHSDFIQAAHELGMLIAPETRIALDDHNPITIMKAKKQ